MSTTSSPPTAHTGRDGDNRILGPPLARDLLVRLGDVDDLRDAGQRLDARRVDPSIVAHQPDGRSLGARHGARFVAHLVDGANDALDLLRSGPVPHHDEH